MNLISHKNSKSMGKFGNLKTEADTILLLREPTIFQGFDVMMELWIYERIQAQSVIFYKKDVENLTDEDLKNIIIDHYETESVTLSRADSDYVFLNFNFVISK